MSLKDASKPDGEACNKDGTLKDAEELEWPDSPTETTGNKGDGSEDGNEQDSNSDDGGTKTHRFKRQRAYAGASEDDSDSARPKRQQVSNQFIKKKAVKLTYPQRRLEKKHTSDDEQQAAPMEIDDDDEGAGPGETESEEDEGTKRYNEATAKGGHRKVGRCIAACFATFDLLTFYLIVDVLIVAEEEESTNTRFATLLHQGRPHDGKW